MKIYELFVTSKSTKTEYRIVLFGPNYSNNRIIRGNSGSSLDRYFIYLSAYLDTKYGAEMMN